VIRGIIYKVAVKSACRTKSKKRRAGKGLENKQQRIFDRAQRVESRGQRAKIKSKKAEKQRQEN
jgi:hypothetical protein